MGVIKLGGVNLAPSNGGYYISNVVRPLPSLEAEFRDGASDGETLENAALRNPLIEFDIWMTGSTGTQRREQIRELSKKLAVKSGTKLEFSDDDGKYYQVVRQGDVVPQEFIDSAVIHVAFKSLYPWMFGTTQTFSSGESFVPDGNYPGVIENSGYSDITSDSNGVIAFGGLTFNTGYADAVCRLSKYNTETRQSELSVNGTYLGAPNISGTWPSPRPGSSMTINITKGTGTIRFLYRPRWV